MYSITLNISDDKSVLSEDLIELDEKIARAVLKLSDDAAEKAENAAVQLRLRMNNGILYTEIYDIDECLLSTKFDNEELDGAGTPNDEKFNITRTCDILNDVLSIKFDNGISCNQIHDIDELVAVKKVPAKKELELVGAMKVPAQEAAFKRPANVVTLEVAVQDKETMRPAPGIVLSEESMVKNKLNRPATGILLSEEVSVKECNIAKEYDNNNNEVLNGSITRNIAPVKEDNTAKECDISNDNDTATECDKNNLNIKYSIVEENTNEIIIDELEIGKDDVNNAPYKIDICRNEEEFNKDMNRNYKESIYKLYKMSSINIIIILNNNNSCDIVTLLGNLLRGNIVLSQNVKKISDDKSAETKSSINECGISMNYILSKNMLCNESLKNKNSNDVFGYNSSDENDKIFNIYRKNNDIDVYIYKKMIINELSKLYGKIVIWYKKDSLMSNEIFEIVMLLIQNYIGVTNEKNLTFDLICLILSEIQRENNYNNSSKINFRKTFLEDVEIQSLFRDLLEDERDNNSKVICGVPEQSSMTRFNQFAAYQLRIIDSLFNAKLIQEIRLNLEQIAIDPAQKDVLYELQISYLQSERKEESMSTHSADMKRGIKALKEEESYKFEISELDDINDLLSVKLWGNDISKVKNKIILYAKGNGSLNDIKKELEMKTDNIIISITLCEYLINDKTLQEPLRDQLLDDQKIVQIVYKNIDIPDIPMMHKNINVTNINIHSIQHIELNTSINELNLNDKINNNIAENNWIILQSITLSNNILYIGLGLISKFNNPNNNITDEKNGSENDNNYGLLKIFCETELNYKYSKGYKFIQFAANQLIIYLSDNKMQIVNSDNLIFLSNGKRGHLYENEKELLYGNILNKLLNYIGINFINNILILNMFIKTIINVLIISSINVLSMVNNIDIVLNKVSCNKNEYRCNKIQLNSNSDVGADKQLRIEGHTIDKNINIRNDDDVHILLTINQNINVQIQMSKHSQDENINIINDNAGNAGDKKKDRSRDEQNNVINKLNDIIENENIIMDYAQKFVNQQQRLTQLQNIFTVLKNNKMKCDQKLNESIFNNTNEFQKIAILADEFVKRHRNQSYCKTVTNPAKQGGSVLQKVLFWLCIGIICSLVCTGALIEAGVTIVLYGIITGSGLILCCAVLSFLLGVCIMSLIDSHKMNQRDLIVTVVASLFTLLLGVDFGVFAVSIILYIKNAAKPHYNILGDFGFEQNLANYYDKKAGKSQDEKFDESLNEQANGKIYDDNVNAIKKINDYTFELDDKSGEEMYFKERILSQPLENNNCNRLELIENNYLSNNLLNNIVLCNYNITKILNGSQNIINLTNATKYFNDNNYNYLELIENNQMLITVSNDGCIALFNVYIRNPNNNGNNNEELTLDYELAINVPQKPHTTQQHLRPTQQHLEISEQQEEQKYNNLINENTSNQWFMLFNILIQPNLFALEVSNKEERKQYLNKLKENKYNEVKFIVNNENINDNDVLNKLNKGQYDDIKCIVAKNEIKDILDIKLDENLTLSIYASIDGQDEIRCESGRNTSNALLSGIKLLRKSSSINSISGNKLLLCAYHIYSNNFIILLRIYYFYIVNYIIYTLVQIFINELICCVLTQWCCINVNELYIIYYDTNKNNKEYDIDEKCDNVLNINDCGINYIVTFRIVILVLNELIISTVNIMIESLFCSNKGIKIINDNSYKKDILNIISNTNEVTDNLLSGTSYQFSGINTDNSYAQTKQLIFNKYIQMGKEFINTKLDELNKKYDNITIEMNELTRLNGEQLNNINDKNVSLNINNEYKINNALKLNKMQQLCTVSKDQIDINKLENKECNNNNNNNEDVMIDIEKDNRLVDNNGSGTLNSQNNKQLETVVSNGNIMVANENIMVNNGNASKNNNQKIFNNNSVMNYGILIKQIDFIPHAQSIVDLKNITNNNNNTNAESVLIWLYTIKLLLDYNLCNKCIDYLLHHSMILKTFDIALNENISNLNINESIEIIGDQFKKVNQSNIGRIETSLIVMITLMIVICMSGVLLFIENYGFIDMLMKQIHSMQYNITQSIVSLKNINNINELLLNVNTNKILSIYEEIKSENIGKQLIMRICNNNNKKNILCNLLSHQDCQYLLLNLLRHWIEISEIISSKYDYIKFDGYKQLRIVNEIKKIKQDSDLEIFEISSFKSRGEVILKGSIVNDILCLCY